MAFELPKLPYSVDALEPYIDAQTMTIHHTKHHQTYTTNLNAALEKNYPKSAKQQGVEGVARIKVRVLASGKLQPLATLSETYPGFAGACKASLRDISWRPGLDQAGQPVATDIPYKCEYIID